MISDLKEYLEQLLHRQDRASMQATIESRIPFLDFELVNLVVNLPIKYKVRLRQSKYLLKRIAEKYLPKEIVYRKKIGFGIPVLTYFRKCNLSIFEGGFVEDTFSISHQTLDEIFVKNPWDLFTFLNLEIWGRIFFNHESVESIASRYFSLRTVP